MLKGFAKARGGDVGCGGSQGFEVCGLLFDVASCGHGLVAGDGGVDAAGPSVDASGEGLDVVEALIAEPHGYAEGTGSVMAEDDDGGVGVELLVGAGGDFAHGHQERFGQVGGLVFPGLADVQQERSVGLLAKLGEGLGRDFWLEHGFKDSAGSSGGLGTLGK